MDESTLRPYRLAKELSQLFDLESEIDTVLSVSMYNLNQFMDAERSSIFIFDPTNQQLISFSSLDLEKHEVRMSKSTGISGWVFENRKPALVNNAYEDSRFYRGVDDMTGFRTRNLICTPLMDTRDHCLGTLQSLNKKSGNFTNEDLELLDLTARMVAVAINNSKRYNDIRITNDVRKKLIKKIMNNIDHLASKTSLS